MEVVLLLYWKELNRKMEALSPAAFLGVPGMYMVIKDLTWVASTL